VTVTIGNANTTSHIRRLDVLLGNVHDDGVVNSQDVVLMRNMLLGFAGPVTISGDIDGNGVVDISDYNVVRQGVGTKLPPLGPPV